jgi:hypothetical protein
MAGKSAIIGMGILRKSAIFISYILRKDAYFVDSRES